MTFLRRPLVLALVAVAALGLSGCGGDDDDSTGGGERSTVSVDDNFFEPETLDVSAGDTVRWEWTGEAPHNVTGEDFKSDTQTDGDFEHTFDEAGTYDYVCTLHPEMTGTIEVAA